MIIRQDIRYLEVITWGQLDCSQQCHDTDPGILTAS